MTPRQVSEQVKLLIKEITIIDSRDATKTQEVDVLIVGPMIERVEPSIPAGDIPVLDGSGRYALPGLVNAHDHLYSHELRRPIPELGLSGMRRWLDQRSVAETVAVMLRNARARLPIGIVATRDLGANHGLNTDIAKIIESDMAMGPVVVASGRPIVMTGGHVYTFGEEADGPWACRTAVRQQAKRGAKVIKIMASGGLSRFPEEDFGITEFSKEELDAIVDEASHRSLPTCAHAFGTEAVHRALEAGVDSIEHGVMIDRADLELMVDQEIAYVPTLSNMRRVAEITRRQAEVTGHDQGRYEQIMQGVVEPHNETFSRAVRAGVRVGVGTDSTGDYSEELELMESLGLSPERVIKAATFDGAEICRVNAGVIEEGKLGSVLLYDHDPRLNVRRLTNPDVVVHKGVLVGRIPNSGPGKEPASHP